MIRLLKKWKKNIQNHRLTLKKKLLNINSLMGKLNEITDENFQKEVLESTKPYVVTYSALSYCQPCIQLHKLLESEIINHSISEKVNFGTVAVEDKGINISSQAGVKGVPTTIIYQNGERISEKVGAVSAQNFIDWVKSSIV